MNPKPIDTMYKGYKFRSRLEARWAVFFDALSIEWEYEKEGYDLGVDGCYLPDFWLPQVSMWAEVKGKPFTGKELLKCCALARCTDCECLLLAGTPTNKAYHTTETLCCPFSAYAGFYLTPMLFNENRFWFIYEDDEYKFDDIEKAVIAARSARFEHGDPQCPNP